MIGIVETKIELEQLIQYVSDPQVGAVSTFSGIVRNHNLGKNVLFLEYEAYVPMATKQMEHIETQVRQKWSIHEFAMVHRLGRLDIGEASIVIVVSSIHRKESLAAVKFAIDTLKKTVPVWKKEYFEGGEVWLENCCAEED